MNIIEKVLERIQLEEGMNQTQLSDYLGYTPNAVSKWRLRNTIPKKSKKLLHDKLGISYSFIDTGKGPYKSENEYPIQDLTKSAFNEENFNIGYVSRKNLSAILHIPIEAEYGFVNNMDQSPNIEDREDWTIPDFNGAAYSFKVKGDKMGDTLKEGDILVTRRRSTTIDLIATDYIYAIKMSTGIRINRLSQHSKDGMIWFIHDNPNHKKEEVKTADIIDIYQGRRIITHDLTKKRKI